MIIEFGEHAPDLPVLGRKACSVKNALPNFRSYRPLNSISTFSAALAGGVCQGAGSFVDKDGNVYTYASDGANIYQLSDTAWTDVTNTGGAYSTSTSTYWEFAQYGNKVIATNFSDVMQVITLGSANFTDLAGTPPQARHLCVAKGFVITGNTFDGSDGNVPNRVRWSGIDDETTWTVSATTQSDFQNLKGNGGWVQRLIAADDAIVFQERAIWIMKYVGSPLVFDFYPVEQSRGALVSRSVVQVGNMAFYLADDGFYSFSNGTSTPIGSGKVNKTFFADFDISNKLYMNGAVDVQNQVVIWIYPGAGNTSGVPNKLLAFHWPSNRWGYGEIDAEFIFAGLGGGYTLDGLDSVSSSIDTLPASLDSRLWTGGNTVLMAFDNNHKLGTFTGTAKDAVLDTEEIQFGTGTAEILEIRPVVDGGTHTAQIGHRSTQAGTITWSSASSENASGICPIRVNDKYHRVRINNTGNFNDAQGVDVRFVQTGDR